MVSPFLFPLFYITFTAYTLPRIMRRTGKYYRLNIVAALVVVADNILLSFWNDRTSSFEYYFDLVPLGGGYAAFLTTSLIVSPMFPHIHDG
jgi:hypothetical protein